MNKQYTANEWRDIIRQSVAHDAEGIPGPLNKLCELLIQHQELNLAIALAADNFAKWGGGLPLPRTEEATKPKRWEEL